MTFRITATAAREILEAAARSDAVGMALRVAARATPGGVDYGMGFDQPGEDDDIQVVDGLTVVVGAPSRNWLEGTVLDYVEIEPGRRDFIFAASAAVPGTGSPTSTASAAGEGKSCGNGGCSGCGH